MSPFQTNPPLPGGSASFLGIDGLTGDLVFLGAVLLAVAALAGMVGFLSARAHYRKRITRRTEMFAGEIARLRRQLSGAEAQASRLRLEADRFRRRRARGG